MATPNPRALLTGTTPGPWEVEPVAPGAPDFDVFVSRINERGERRGRFYIAENMTPANARLADAALTALATPTPAMVEAGAKEDELHEYWRWVDREDGDCEQVSCTECNWTGHMDKWHEHRAAAIITAALTAAGEGRG